jgi:hypothetical protein
MLRRTESPALGGRRQQISEGGWAPRGVWGLAQRGRAEAFVARS